MPETILEKVNDILDNDIFDISFIFDEVDFNE
jgi:hypothetical protein